MTKDITAISEEIKSLFRSITTNFRAAIAEHVGDEGFTYPQIMLMQELYNTPGITLIELSHKLGLAKSTVSGIVDRLVKQGAVIRTTPDDDRRTVRLSLAPKRLEFQTTINLIKHNYMAEMLKDADPEELEEILNGLRKLKKLVTKSNAQK